MIVVILTIGRFGLKLMTIIELLNGALLKLGFYTTFEKSQELIHIPQFLFESASLY